MRAKIRRSVLGALIVVPLVLAQGTQSNAATVQFEGAGVAKGISGLTVGTETFNISFIHQPYAVAFPLGELFGASLMSAIVFALNTDDVQSVKYSNSSVTSKRFFVPVLLGSSGINATRSECSLPSSGTVTPPSLLCKWDNPGVQPLFPADESKPWAIPVLVTTPLPSALPLFGTALGLLGFMGWRRRRKSRA